MKKPGLSDRERKLLEDARRHAAAQRGAPAARPAAKAATAATPAMPPAALSPLDGRTVVGWDHPAARAMPPGQPAAAGRNPAAQGAPAQDADAKWSQIAVLMEAERAAANDRRRRARRAVTVFAGVLLVVALLVATRLLLKR